MDNTAPQGEALFEATGIDLALGGKVVLQAAAARVNNGEIVTLIGPNGAGKTIFIKVILGLVKPDGGGVFRRPGIHIGYMPQRLSLEPSLPLTVDRFLALAARRGGTRQRRAAVLAEVGAAGVMDAPMQVISGGELQRVMLARALLRDPDLLVLDEPVQGVDISGQADLYRLIERIRTERGCGVFLVSHDLHLVMAATDRVVCLNQHVCCAGAPETVISNPACAALFGEQAGEALALYRHHHNHRHEANGSIISLPESGESAPAGSCRHG
ncbi:MAG TPA: ATP-binding cassette domain-containing protein [Rhodospirillales bacterium]|jgi:zinc transport system ATP-binding protein|nr:ATP-binding cassette domain-containing protein [Rhodospirillales bacterium]